LHQQLHIAGNLTQEETGGSGSSGKCGQGNSDNHYYNGKHNRLYEAKQKC